MIVFVVSCFDVSEKQKQTSTLMDVCFLSQSNLTRGEVGESRKPVVFTLTNGINHDKKKNKAQACFLPQGILFLSPRVFIAFFPFVAGIRGLAPCFVRRKEWDG